jgi:hypothetical protein
MLCCIRMLFSNSNNNEVDLRSSDRIPLRIRSEADQVRLRSEADQVRLRSEADQHVPESAEEEEEEEQALVRRLRYPDGLFPPNDLRFPEAWAAPRLLAPLPRLQRDDLLVPVHVLLLHRQDAVDEDLRLPNGVVTLFMTTTIMTTTMMMEPLELRVGEAEGAARGHCPRLAKRREHRRRRDDLTATAAMSTTMRPDGPCGL